MASPRRGGTARGRAERRAVSRDPAQAGCSCELETCSTPSRRSRVRGPPWDHGGMPSFAGLPSRIEALTREHERVALILLDGFGMKFVERHASHPLLKRLEIEPLASQFPSTTTAHLTTLYTGLPVEQHGLYEWKCFEPRLDDVIVPLRF